MESVNIYAKITGIKYKPQLVTTLEMYNFDEFDVNKIPPICIVNENGFIYGISKWVSPKRTRSYPYERVYNKSGTSKRITIIPIIKDEGKEGDRDFIQWDTISLMSLLGVYVILGYYKTATKSKHENKITNQRFDLEYITEEINNILTFHSDALHWNLEQLDRIGELIIKARECYQQIENDLQVKLHSWSLFDKRAENISKAKDFMRYSRELAKKAQNREVATVQPKEKLEGKKAKLTIRNNVCGHYFLTCDEVQIHDEVIYLIEGKHTRNKLIPSVNDVKDGLLKIVLLCNIEKVRIGSKEYVPKPILKLTSVVQDVMNKIRSQHKTILRTLQKESEQNNFEVIINGSNLKEVLHYDQR
jgi:hypothetical protein